MPKLVISFKNNKEELDLYEDIIKHSDKSAYVKDILRGLVTNINQTNISNTNDIEDDLLSQLTDINFGG